MKKQLIHNAKVITPFRTIEDGFLILSGKKIQFIGSGDTDAVVLKNELAGADEVFDVKGYTLLPGFLPTVGCFASPDSIFLSAKKLSELIQKPLQGAKALGINMEGPFLHPELGAQDKSNCLGEIDLNYLKRLIAQTGDAIKIMTISPELNQAMDGDMILVDNNFTILATFVEGEMVYRKPDDIPGKEALNRF